MTTTPPQLTETQRARLGVLAETLIAGGAGLPSAKEADVQSVWIDRVLSARPDLFESVRTAALTTGDPQAALDRLSAEDPNTLELLRYAVAAAYLINPKVRALLGYPSSVPGRQPAYPDEAEAYLEDGILDPVINRGSIFRPTPKSD